MRTYLCSTLLFTAMLLGCQGCGATTMEIKGGPEVPAAQGRLRHEATSNGNTRLDLDLEHLAPPDRVAPGATVYVVWVRPANADAQQAPQNVGALVTGSDLHARIQTLTPHRSFDLFLTVEAVPTVEAPLGKELIKVRVNRP